MRTLAAVVLVLSLVACKSKGDPPAETGTPNAAEGSAAPAAPATNKAAFEARRVFQTVCATCHGPEGKGDGAASSALQVKPRNYTDKAWQSSVTDDEIKKIILLGGQAVGKNAAMPAQPQLQNQPEVVDELVKIIRGFGA
jgi:mono/diheme cytochrome c family protein